ncbi:MAG: hypothetical protein N2319_06265 [Candidatus Kapabacteria bacterium]|nr:hypothetical protein [Candidatus Kapabacteria bacterium]
MKRHFIFIFAITIFLFSCSKNEEAIKEPEKIPNLTVLNFEQEAPKYVGKTIKLEGIVSHTCKHGGKRMFLIDKNDSLRVEITAGKNVEKFGEELVGSTVVVEGIVKEERVDEKFLADWENEVLNPDEEKHEGKKIHTGEEGHDKEDTQRKLRKINNLREELRASGKKYLSFFSVEANKFEEKK